MPPNRKYNTDLTREEKSLTKKLEDLEREREACLSRLVVLAEEIKQEEETEDDRREAAIRKRDEDYAALVRDNVRSVGILKKLLEMLPRFNVRQVEARKGGEPYWHVYSSGFSYADGPVARLNADGSVLSPHGKRVKFNLYERPPSQWDF